jgi:2-hydroxy-3-keto-5-methylthiopentenyl-1-phosphate phosphatase|tara:strand:+ start:561 stop:917 length:357 start_codon:yes stop_codon:yes gene_type:complete
MIPSFERETSPLTDAEKKLIPLLIKGFQNYIGKKNAIPGSMIRKKLKLKNIKISGPRLRKMINHIRTKDKSIILCSCGNGYYIASNTDEIKETIKSIQHRVNSQLEIIDALDNSLRMI